jgi:hypothetical protein
MRRASILLLLIPAVIAASHCSTPAKHVHSIRRLIPSTLRFRRPPTPGADVRAGPGGVDYRSQPLPNEQFDCETVDALFKELNLEDVRSCISAQATLYVAIYNLVREAVPYLELEETEETPACLVKTLPRISVPREIFFQSYDHERTSCYSARLNWDVDRFMGIKLPSDQLAIRIMMPMEKEPEDAREMLRLLTAWAITPLWSKDKTLPSKIVPDQICRKCLGKHNLMGGPDPEPELWPTPEPSPSPTPEPTASP